MSNIFDDIASGNLSLDNYQEEVVTEAVFPDSLPYLKMLKKQVTLPQGTPIGRGNLCFLYSRNINESIQLMKSKNFMSKNRYSYYYCDFKYQGKLYNKRYRIFEKEERDNNYEKIEKDVNVKGRKHLLNTSSDNRNMYFDMYRYIEIFESICNRLQNKLYISLYWEFINSQIYKQDIQGYPKRFVLVDLSFFKLSNVLRDNFTNPLYLIYYTLLRYPELLKDVDIDFYFFKGNSVLKINPHDLNEKLLPVLKAEMKKMFPSSNVSKIIDDVTSEENIKKDDIVDNTTNKITATITPLDTEEEIVSTKVNVSNATADAIKVNVRQKVQARVDQSDILDTDLPLDEDDVSDNLSNYIKQEIDEDRELIEKIYYQSKNQTNTKSEASTARDKMLREQQKEIKLGNSTLAELEKVVSSKIDIPVNDVSRNVSTINKNMTEIRFQNLDKTYNDKVLKKDLMNSILSLNDKSIPMFVRDIKVEDTSDELNYKDTYTILLEDGNRKRHTVKVDIPKFIDDRFLYIGGNKKIIKHQNFLLPVVKIAPDMVQIVTNYSKMSIQRVENKSTSAIERLKKVIKLSEDIEKYFSVGNVYTDNDEFITTIEYDDLSKHYSSFKSGKTQIFFSQKDASEYMKKNDIKEKKGKMFIGLNKGNSCFIDIDDQTDEFGNTITDIIINSMPDNLRDLYEKTKPPKQLMYAKVRIMSQFVSVAMLLGLWEGMSTVLKKLNVKYRLEDKVPTNLKANEEFIKFKDCVMVYSQNVQIAMVMNGFKRFETQDYNLAEFDEKIPYLDYIKKRYGRAIIENALMNFYEFAIDPITLEILRDKNLPEDLVSLFIYAINLLADSHYVVEINQQLSRVRCNEIIPAILYEKIAKNYVTFRNYNGRKKFSLPQDCIIKEILQQKTVEDYSTLNPTLEMEMTHSISSKGFRGVNLPDSYTVPKRSYDPSMIGIIAPSTQPDGMVGINKTLSLEPMITGVRGYTEDNHDNLGKLKDVNLFAPAELSIPLSATIDDPNRLGFSLNGSNVNKPI